MVKRSELKNSKLKILEIGSSSMLDIEYDHDKIYWVKTLHQNQPKNKDHLFTVRTKPKYGNFDVIIFSTSIRSNKDNSYPDVLWINVNRFLEKLIETQTSTKNKLFILLNENNESNGDQVYLATKAFQSELFKQLSKSSNSRFVEFKIDPVKTRSNKLGMSNELVAKYIIEFIGNNYKNKSIENYQQIILTEQILIEYYGSDKLL